MKEEGVQFTCNKCGKKEFMPYRHYPVNNTHICDNGNWSVINKDICLCKECGDEYKEILKAFLGGEE